MNIAVKRLPSAEGLPLPAYATEMAAGADVCAAEEHNLAPGAWVAVGTGLAFEIPAGLEIQVRPRSGLAARQGVTVLNAPGTIDADYRGELRVLLINHGREPFIITRGMRIAQIVVAPVARAAFSETQRLSETARGEGGFGSTGR
ncbi:MAG: Deoxyuridine 5'-triphosphate nucleotidohydrolase [Planctomycetes bacterium]|nr:Deoxyuridine 5'-triphosphate nucleotidohydrolase [Planctomycetota bacterium]MCQ3949254.1 dUTP diphosphatase [Planctomycetota bacterium]GIK52671.1 MAG: deoxyuridine 5'-triphosphate nucleotidohydrolase [Planctomycetota bacterium]HRJ78608.1 dUTP diphosphatase [Planctomycetota bacterium]